jgi:hypothetical protein
MSDKKPRHTKNHFRLIPNKNKPNAFLLHLLHTTPDPFQITISSVGRSKRKQIKGAKKIKGENKIKCFRIRNDG